MCIFSVRVDHVGATCIFAGDQGDGVHAVAYQMSVEAPEPAAMILPVPVRRGLGDDALTFVDLGESRTFFLDLARCFPAHPGGYGPAGPDPRMMLAVHKVGDYVASYVPSLADFDRLDPRFRLPESAWATLPDYRDFGFAVFQLRPGQDTQRPHPMAYRYPARFPEELFFPTVHIHDGNGPEPEARYEHVLFAQAPWTGTIPGHVWETGSDLPGQFMKAPRSQGLVAPDIHLRRATLSGYDPKADIVLRRIRGGLKAEAWPTRSGPDADTWLEWPAFQDRRRFDVRRRY